MLKNIFIIAVVVFLQSCGGGAKKDGSSDTILGGREAASVDISEQEGLAVDGSDRQQQFERPNATLVFYFAFDRAELDAISQEALKQHAQYIIQTGLSVVIEGNTDEKGTREYNIALGEQRANSVRDFLTDNGVADQRISVVSFGEEKLVNYDNNEVADAQNRRAILRYGN